MINFEMNNSEIDRILNNLANLEYIDEPINNTFFKVGVDIVERAYPYIPIDEGMLLGSNNITIKVKDKISSHKVELKKMKKNNEKPDISSMSDVELLVSFDVDYATEIHEEYQSRPERPGIKSREKFYESGLISDVNDEAGARKTGFNFLGKAYSESLPIIKRDIGTIFTHELSRLDIF